jgi:hypothetical protein
MHRKNNLEDTPMNRFLIAASLVLSACLIVHSASACDQHRIISSGLPYYGYGYSGSLYGLGFVPVPPYFALHPPVHYSHRVSTTYGRSPFAASHLTEKPAPQIIVNHLAPAPKADPYQAAGIIVNPYYNPEASPSDQPADVAPAIPPEKEPADLPPTLEPSAPKPPAPKPPTG